MVSDDSIESIRLSLPAELHRWRAEINSRPRSTLWHGVATKIGAYLDQLFALSVATALRIAGEAGVAVVAGISNGKPLERLTMGQRMRILITLDARRLMGSDAKLLKKSGKDLLQETVSIRTDFAHGYIPREEGRAETLRLLDLAEDVCTEDLFQYLGSIDA